MTQINLLPWREQARQEKKIRFGIVMGICVAATIFLLVIVHMYMSSLITTENARSAFLQTQLGARQGQFSVLRDKKQKQDAITSDLNFLSTLREKSFRTVQLMNLLVQLVPTTITLDKLVKEGNKINLIGRAQSELQITLFMKNIAKSTSFNQPVLTRISETPAKSDISRIFELQIEQK